MRANIGLNQVKGAGSLIWLFSSGVARESLSVDEPTFDAISRARVSANLKACCLPQTSTI